MYVCMYVCVHVYVHTYVTGHLESKSCQVEGGLDVSSSLFLMCSPSITQMYRTLKALF